ncbi:peptidase, membrane zinc metallopeptidase, putative [Alkaliphilus metalliredigens QYMF]|uniref:Peptidase, membrane zinc metallopeptidase, putative n=1 Tax=Alkaliphilus metalliredigens (strain QYMF) TaxID=293826 RepID=A6TRW5_ALKMQ|nr:zinc metallopeptidase [Alkaliphilus metalliredigens]ABR48933.1 peptidase, membrane zinc metallopeptidase, putative [Alkaliphilus metalliredigens QYMF]
MFYPYGLFDPTMIVLIPAIIFTMYAQGKVKSTFAKYLRVPARRGFTGVQVARAILDKNGLQDVPIETSPGSLTDHYDPRKRVLRLSGEVYQGNSIASVSVAAHEVGHAIQHANGYVPLSLRNVIFPVASFGSSAAWFFIIGGLLIPSMAGLMDIGILLFGAAVAFQVVTLPVEFNASSRALTLLDAHGFIVDEERKGVQKVLRAAALTYVAAMASAIAQMLRLILIRNRRR